jgi:endonuclease/exonuclease/phosphatase (EEP) superfamily protein YafD
MSESRPAHAYDWIGSSLAAPFALLALARLAAHDAVLPLVWANAITPWLYLPVWPLLALSIYLRRKVPIALSGFVAICHLVWVVPSIVPAGSYDPNARILRVATANLLYGNRRSITLLRELRSIEADVLVLEEVTPEWWASIESSELRTAYPHRAVSARNDAFGIAILSRVPIVRSEMTDLEDVPMIDATIAIEGGHVRILGVHTLPPVDSAYAAVWRAQLARIARIAREDRGALIVMGDLNATRHAAGFAALEREGLRDAHDARGRGLATTWPNGLRSLPPMHLDHVLSTDPLVAIAVREGVGAGSDHRPVVVDFAAVAALEERAL